MNKVNLVGLLGLIVIIFSAVGLYALGESNAPEHRVLLTVAEVQTVHGAVKVDGHPVTGVRRLGSEAKVDTDVAGRARMRLDNGATVVVDGNTSTVVQGDKLDLIKGRVLLRGDGQHRTSLRVGKLTIRTLDGVLGLDLRASAPRVFCADGEATVIGQDKKESRLTSGESATMAEGKLKVEPEIAFEDWTGGLATPWSADGQPKVAVGQLWGRVSRVLKGGLGKAFTIRSTEIMVEVRGEVATTVVRTTYFNGGSKRRFGDFRMPLPAAAVVTGFGSSNNGVSSDRRCRVSTATQNATQVWGPVLEWAGDGWVRGRIPAVNPGGTVTVTVKYEQWLSPDNGRLVYRLPLIGQKERVGEFLARVHFNSAQPREISANLGAKVLGNFVTLRASDFVPSADFVVEATPAFPLSAVRAYVAPGKQNSSSKYAVFRFNVPSSDAPEGVTLAIVLDDSSSMSSERLGLARSVVSSLIGSLSAKDRVVVVAADQGVRFVGPDKMGPVDDKRRASIRKALGAIRPGGATDIGKALRKAASLLPSTEPSAMIVYVGDGWATTGQTSPDKLRAVLQQRPQGLPRVAVMATGASCNMLALGQIARGLGPVYHVVDSAFAGTAVSRLLADALQPTLSNVRLSFPSNFEWTYPQRPVHVRAGGAFTAVGRFEGTLPKQVKLSWQGKRGQQHRVVRVKTMARQQARTVRRRWALARLDELGYAGAGREAVVEIGRRYQLLTPWTGWSPFATGSEYRPTPLSYRVMFDQVQVGSPFMASFATPSTSFGSLEQLLEEPASTDEPLPARVAKSIRYAAKRVLRAAASRFRACSQARMSVRPELHGNVEISLKVKVDGTPADVRVDTAGSGQDDTALSACFAQVVSGLRFPVGVADKALDVSFTYTIVGRSRLRARRCSPTSKLPLGLRRGIWLQRLLRGRSPVRLYREAKRSCEMRTWSAKRTFLELMMARRSNAVSPVSWASMLAEEGEQDAAGWLREQALRRARTPAELKSVRKRLLQDEVLPVGAFRKKYLAAKTNEGRLKVVSRFLQVAPHHPALRRQYMVLLRAMKKTEELKQAVAKYRQDYLSSAEVLAEGASALRKLGEKQEASRTFGGLVERAPQDPAVRAFLGDRLLAEQMPTQAIEAFEVLDRLAPGMPTGLMRLALAYHDAGRHDIALRMLERLAQTGGRSGDATMASGAERMSTVWLKALLAQGKLGSDAKALLESRLKKIPWHRDETLILVRTPRMMHAMRLRTGNRSEKPMIVQPADVASSVLGLASVRLSGDVVDGLQIMLDPPKRLPPIPHVATTVYVVHGGPSLQDARFAVWRGDVPLDGKTQTLSLRGDVLQPGK